ncbi:MAG: biopolymer transporter ExbD [Simkania sp.]|nr:biopolymer transporter ExbD [Simkania sp.]
MRKHHFTLSRSIDDEGLVNLTPLIDVVFVVLILFILVAPLLELDRVALACAAKEGTKEALPIQENAPIKIHVFADNTIWIGNTCVKTEDLYPYLKKCKAEMPHTIPQVYHDKEAFFGTYQTVKNALEAAGFEEMDVILKPS